MATIDVKITSNTTVTFTYTITNTALKSTLAVSGATFKNTRDGGLPRPYRITLRVAGISTLTTTVNEGTKTKNLSFSGSDYRTRSHSDNSLNVGVRVEMYALDLTNYNYDKSSTLAWSVPARPKYAVTYAANGGATTPATGYQWHDEPLVLSDAISYNPSTSYSFAYWTASNGTAYSAKASYDKNVATTMTAQWNRTITYNANGGSGTPSSQTKLKSQALTLSSAKPTKAGYRFLGWGTASNSTSASYQPGGTYAANNPTRTLYAVWGGMITSISAWRCDSSGEPADEGTCMKLSVSWTKSQNASSAAPTLALTCTPSITMPTSTLSGTSGTYESGVIAGPFDTETKYTISASLTDSVTTGAAHDMTATLDTVFYTMDVLGDSFPNKRPGHGIAFGAPCKSEGFLVNMPSTFVERIDKQSAAGAPTRADDAPGSDTNLFSEHYQDSAGASLGYSSIVKNTNNNIYRSFAVRNQTDSGTEVTAGIYVTAGRDGTRSASLASGMAWPVAYGGTGITNFGATATVNGSNVSVANNSSSYAKLASVTLQPGKWLVYVGCYAAYNANGARIFTMSTASSVTAAAGRGVTVQVNSAASTCYVPITWVFTPSAATTYNVFAWQNCGAALNMSAYIYYVRIG